MNVSIQLGQPQMEAALREFKTTNWLNYKSTEKYLSTTGYNHY